MTIRLGPYEGRSAVRRIIQKDEMGCGVACVAMLSGRTYAEVRRRMFGDGEVAGTKAPFLREHLERLGCRVDALRLKPLKKLRYSDLEYDAILKVWPRQDGNWHWVVWDSCRRRVLDPEEPPYVRIRATHYLPVRRPDRRRPRRGRTA